MNDPGSNHSLTAGNILASFPIALQDDASAAALGEITARLLARRPEEISQLRIYPMIDQLPERLLDILAYDFKVDWWDPNYTLEEKRRTLKESWRVHKMLGTRAAVEMAIRAVYPNTEVLEWFEYEGGKPYHFKLNIDLSDIQCDETRPWRVLERVNFYKSLRSHLEEFQFTARPKQMLACQRRQMRSISELRCIPAACFPVRQNYLCRRIFRRPPPPPFCAPAGCVPSSQIYQGGIDMK